MSARLLSGKEVAAAVRVRVAEDVAELSERGKRVGLATVLVGADPASEVYIRSKHRAAAEAGIYSFERVLGTDATQQQVEDTIAALNADSQVDGMIVQLPLPQGLDANAAVESIAPGKDADGLHPYNLGRLVLEQEGPVPATPLGIMSILKHYEVATEGKLAVVVGRSFLVGRPLSLLLAWKGVDCTVVQAHSRTPDLPALTSRADILVAAVGRPAFITAEHVKQGAVVIDVGINRTADGLVGDVAFDEVADKAGAVTPVPGGVGPMTVASLLANTVALARRRLEG